MRPPILHREVFDLVGDVDPGSLDAIVTDPPYKREYVDAGVYRDLALFASYALRPGGHLLAMTAQAHFPAIFDHLTVAGLCYQWTLAYRVTGGGPPISTAASPRWAGNR